ncbi:MAG: exodeoxyribonuclease I [Planctomycetes bacterium]|nr:exodeoxyribonuclease I [Planctomycetota bacterium]
MSQAFIELMGKHRFSISEKEAKSAYQSMPESYRNVVKEDTLVDYLTQRYRDNILWHDYEAGGTDAKATQPLQFAAVRTDLKHRVLDEPIDIYCKLAGDKYPHPVAIAITHINPMTCMEKGLPEPLFFRQIEMEMSLPCTTVSGFNSMGYDEEVTRFGFWRNLLPVYDREWANNNSRYDTMNMFAAFRALKVPGITWPEREDGRGASLKLEHFAASNGITQENAHNALDDVFALIDASKLLQEKNSELWHLLFKLRIKKKLKGNLSPGATGMFFSASMGADADFSARTLILGPVLGEPNKVVAVNLDKIEALRACYRLSADEISELVFSKKEDLESKGLERPPVFTIALNKAPAFLTDSWCRENIESYASKADDGVAEKLMGHKSAEFVGRLMKVFISDDIDDSSLDPELSLYAAGFPDDHDKMNISTMKGLPLSAAFDKEFEWHNPVYAALWQRARCKLDGYDGLKLNRNERKSWDEHCASQRMIKFSSSDKHEVVTSEDWESELSKTEMDEELRLGYLNWAKSLARI